MKNFILIIAVCLTPIFYACGGKSTLEQVEGHWVMFATPDTRLDIIIDEDGTGQMTICEKEYSGKYKLLVKENITFTENDNELIFTVDNTSSSGNLFVKDGQLYSATGEPFTKLEN